MRAQSPSHIVAYFALVAVLAGGCTPRLSPLYRDYRITERANAQPDIHSRISAALEDAGWNAIDGVTTNIVATESKTFRSYFIYTIEIELEVSPVGEDHVRVFIHPFRKYFTGSRAKMPYLRSGMARSVMKTLQDSFTEAGLEFAGTAQSRDKAYRRSLD